MEGGKMEGRSIRRGHKLGIAVVTILVLLLLWGNAAQAANGTVTRSFSSAAVAPGGTLTVTFTPGVDANGRTVGPFYQVIETLPAGVTVISSTASFVPPNTFTMPGAGSFNYILTVSPAVPIGTVLSFSGIFKDSYASLGIITGASIVTVGASETGANGKVTRSFSSATIPQGGTLTVTLTPGVDANGRTVGFGYQVIETMPAGVTFISSTADNFAPPNTFTMLGSGPLNYVVTVSRALPNGTVLNFSGIFKDDFNKIGIIGGTTSVRVGVSLLQPEVQPFDINGDDIIQRNEAVSTVVQFFTAIPTPIPRQTAVAVVVAFFNPTPV